MEGLMYAYNRNTKLGKINGSNKKSYLVDFNVQQIRSDLDFTNISTGGINFSPDHTDAQFITFTSGFVVRGKISRMFIDQHEVLSKKYGKDIIFTKVESYKSTLSLNPEGDSLFFAFTPSNQKYILINQKTAEIVRIFDIVNDTFYFDKNKNLLIIKEGNSFLLQLENNNHLNNFLRRNSDLLIFKAGTINGAIKNIGYLSEKVHILLSNKGFIFVELENLQLTDEFNFEQLKYFYENKKLFLKNEETLLLLITNEDIEMNEFNKTLISKSGLISEKLGYTKLHHPFTLIQDSEKLYLNQNQSKSILTIFNKDIIDISILDHMEQTSFNKIGIKLKEQSLAYQELYILSTQVPLLIFNTYYHTKFEMISGNSGRQMFTSWSRQANDYVIYNFFGQLFAIKKGIEQTLDNNTNNTKRNIDLVNFLYHGLQAQKKKFDIVSLYLPAYLLQEEQSLLSNIGVNVQNEEAFLTLQQKLYRTATEINDYIREIEISLNAINFVIIPSQSFSSLEDKKANRGIMAGTAMGVTGLALALFTGGSSLILTFSGFMTAVNAISGKNELSKNEEIRKGNQDTVVEFHVLKALDAFEHLMEIILPFYISQINQNVYTTYKVFGEKYSTVLEEPIIKELLLKRLGQHYTFEQLPVDSSVTIKKNVVMEEIQTQVKNSDSILNIFKQGVGDDVFKSISVSKN